MKAQSDKYFMWIESDLLGNIRLQHRNGIIEAVDDMRFKWTIGKTLHEAEVWVVAKEGKRVMEELRVQRNLFEANKERESQRLVYRHKEATFVKERHEDQPTESRDGYQKIYEYNDANSLELASNVLRV